MQWCFSRWWGCSAGLGLWLVWLVCGLLHVSSVLFGVLAVASGVLITGGIHLDGFCDTADALYSRRPQEVKLRILKDPQLWTLLRCSA